jgi:porin
MFLCGTAFILMAAVPISATAQTIAAQTESFPSSEGKDLPVAEESPSASEYDGKLFGDWGGIREKASDAGLDFNFNYVGQFAANLDGGQRKDATWAGQLELGASLDAERAFGIRDTTFNALITYRHGSNLVTRAGLNTILQPQSVYGRGQTWRLTGFWGQHSIGAVDIRAGRMPMDLDFARLPCEFSNLSFCANQTGNLVGDLLFNYPISQWGARIRVQPGPLYAMVGVFEYNPRNLENDFFMLHKGATGVTIPTELGYRSRIGSSGLPGLYRIGSWYNTSKAADLLYDEDRQPFALSGQPAAQRRGRYGGYIFLQQQITGRYSIGPDGLPKTEQGLTLYINWTEADRRTSRFDHQITFWSNFLGPLPSRPNDRIGFAFGQNSINDRAARSEFILNPSLGKPKSEYPFELNYGAYLGRGVTITPNIQYIINPGGYRAADNLIIAGLKTAVQF